MIVSTIESYTGISAKWSGNKARVANPLRKTKDRNVLISDGVDRIRITDFANHSDPKDIVEIVGLSLADLFYISLTPQQKKSNQVKKSQRQVEDECNHAFHVLEQIPLMKANGAVFSGEDKQSIIKARKVLIENNFTEDDYRRIDRERGMDAKHRDRIQRGDKYGQQ